MDKNNIHQYALGVLTYLISMDIVRGAVDSLGSANKIDEHSFNLITFEELIKAIRNIAINAARASFQVKIHASKALSSKPSNNASIRLFLIICRILLPLCLST